MGGPPAWGVGEVLKTPPCKNVSCCETKSKPRDRDRWRTLVTAVMNLRVP